MNVEVLVRVDPAQLVEAGRPGGATEKKSMLRRRDGDPTTMLGPEPLERVEEEIKVQCC